MSWPSHQIDPEPPKSHIRLIRAGKWQSVWSYRFPYVVVAAAAAAAVDDYEFAATHSCHPHEVVAHN